MVISYMKEKIKILPCVLKFQSGYDNHRLYLYNINKHTNTETASVTLTFEIGARFFRATIRLHMNSTCT